MKTYQRICIGCGQEFEAHRADRMTCSGACQKRVNWRKKKGYPISGSVTWHRQDIPKESKPCEQCERMYIPFRSRSRFCSDLCNATWHYQHENTVQRQRICKECNKPFTYDGISHLNYCSDKCAQIVASRAKVSNARRSAQWRKDHPDKTSEYRETQKRRNPEQVAGGLVQRFFAKYPHIKPICQACGESRIVELAHKVPRQGAWRTLKNTTDKDVWILCPTCHRCLDLKIQTQQELGLPD
jgi:hypothetical protein